MEKENVSAISFGVWVPLVPAVTITVITVSVNALVDWQVRRSTAKAAGR